jgi:hypothetical protein
MAVMGQQGDTKITWDKSKPTEVDAARVHFEILMSRKYKAFNVTAKDQPGEPMTEFDPDAERVIFVPQMRGG